MRINIKGPLVGQIEITDKCNIRCLHCYHLDNRLCSQACKSIDLPDAMVMDLAQRMIDAGIFNAVITGGEPLIRKRLTIELVRLFVKNKVLVSLNTNLLLMDQATITALDEGEE
jgi:MoaA/NifB/PqqE/SkfB family radical SAM enzyme